MVKYFIFIFKYNLENQCKKNSAYLVSYSSNRFSKRGLHKRAIKYIRDNGYGTTRSVGITTWCDDEAGIYWSKNVTVEIVLDLKRLVVTYYEIKENINKELEMKKLISLQKK